jgi:hypothetical protein
VGLPSRCIVGEQAMMEVLGMTTRLRRRLHGSAAALLLLAAACGGSAASVTPKPPSAATSPEPSGYTDADQERIVRETIADVFCSDPPSDWCQYGQVG